MQAAPAGARALALVIEKVGLGELLLTGSGRRFVASLPPDTPDILRPGTRVTIRVPAGESPDPAAPRPAQIVAAGNQRVSVPIGLRTLPVAAAPAPRPPQPPAVQEVTARTADGRPVRLLVAPATTDAPAVAPAATAATPGPPSPRGVPPAPPGAVAPASPANLPGTPHADPPAMRPAAVLPDAARPPMPEPSGVARTVAGSASQPARRAPLPAVASIKPEVMPAQPGASVGSALPLSAAVRSGAQGSAAYTSPEAAPVFDARVLAEPRGRTLLLSDGTRLDLDAPLRGIETDAHVRVRVLEGTLRAAPPPRATGPVAEAPAAGFHVVPLSAARAASRQPAPAADDLAEALLRVLVRSAGGAAARPTGPAPLPPSSAGGEAGAAAARGDPSQPAAAAGWLVGDANGDRALLEMRVQTDHAGADQPGPRTFRFDLNLSRVGRVRLELLVIGRARHLVVRTEQPVAEPLRRQIADLYGAALEISGRPGRLVFAPLADRAPPPEPGTGQLLV